MRRIMRIFLPLLLTLSLLPASVRANTVTSPKTAGETTLTLAVHQVTVTCGTGGSFTVDGTTSRGTKNFYTNEGLVITVQPDSGYVINATTKVSGEVEMTVAGGTITLSGVQSDVVVGITFLSTKTDPAPTPKPAAAVSSAASVSSSQDTAEDTAADEPADTDTVAASETIAAGQTTDTTAADADDGAEGEPEQSVLGQTIAPDITSAVVEDGTAILTSEIAEALIVEEDGKNVMVIPLSDLEENITRVALKRDALAAIAERNDGIFRLQTVDMEVEFDTAALRAVIDQAQGDDIYIDVRQIETASLEKSQQKAVQDKVVLFSFSASVMSGDTVISQFYDGSATIRIPFEPEDGIDTSEYAIVYLTTDGEIEVMDSTYEDGYLIFSTSHFSEYAIVRDASLASDDRNGAGYVRWCLPVVLLAAVCGIVLVVLKRKKS